jgi:prepilin-type N-terminal cleavage/methylation domain-containing protein
MKLSISHARPRARRGFSLLEVAVVIAIVGLLVAGLAGPLSSQVDQRRFNDTRALLKSAEDAILVFAATNGRLPCPASATSNGIEVTRDAAGRCQIAGGNGAVIGFVPARTLGLSPVDGQGYATDAWGTNVGNRLGYAIIDTLPPGTGAAGDFPAGPTTPPRSNVSTLDGAFTKDDGLNQPYVLASGTSIRAWQAISRYVNSTYQAAQPAKGLLHVCRTAAGVVGAPANPRCGAPTAGTSTPSANTLTDQTPIVLFSLGPTNNTAPFVVSRTDELENTSNRLDRLFVMHEKAEAAAAGGAFDDVVVWVSLNTLYNKLLEGGKLKP